MAHIHTNEYQLKIVLPDGTEELTAWMQSQEQITEAIAVVHRRRPQTCWLRERRGRCPDCSGREQHIVEYPFAEIRSPRYSPRDSRYLVAVGSKDHYELSVSRR